MREPWYRSAWRRSVLDMHITDDDPRFLSEYDPGRYVALLQKAQVASAVIYGHSHVGLALFPSKVCPVHKGLAGRDILGQTITECHKAGIKVVVYMSLIFDVAAYRREPGWRIILADGRGAAEDNRYGVCCPNSPYRDFAASIARELCERYEFEGIRFDMTFWPAVCYCPHCRKRFAAEAGEADRQIDLPTIVDWDDPRWVAFQRARERWLAEFAELLTSTVRAVKPSISVEHQSSLYPQSWRSGVNELLAPHQDFMQGDFYGMRLQGSVARKLLSNLSPNRPIGFETSIAWSLRNYTALKPAELLETKAYAALADGAAFIFIDSVDPMGTVNPLVYERMGKIFGSTRRYERYLGGDRQEDVALYLSFPSKHDPADNGKRVDDPALSASVPHVEALSQVARALIERHVPWGIISKRNLGELRRWRAIVLPKVFAMDEDEAAAFREYVRQGGSLYAGRHASLAGTDGKRRPDYLLADVFGVSWKGETKESFTYIAPTVSGQGVFGEFTASHPLGLFSTQAITEPHPGAEVLATITLPYSDPADPVHFSSIHNNPPGIPTDYPAVVFNNFGHGKVVWTAGELETAEAGDAVVISLLGLLAAPYSFEADAPKAVEVTAFRQGGSSEGWSEGDLGEVVPLPRGGPQAARWIICLLNFQGDLPNIPVSGIRIRLRTGGRKPSRVLALPEETPLRFSWKNGIVSFTAPRLETFAMFAVDCR